MTRMLLPILLALTAAAPAPVRDRPSLTLDGAKQVAAAAEAQAVKMGLRVSIAIVDPGGNLLLQQRMDDASLASIEIAPGKARTAIGFNQPTKAMQDRLLGEGGLRLTTLPFIMLEGAVPIKVQDQTVGAIGVSGATSAQDGEIAAAGAAAVAR